MKLTVLLEVGSALLATSCMAAECNVTQVWNRMIAAKGGAEKLKSVSAVYIEGTGPNVGWFRRAPIRELSLYVLPSYVWSWFDQRDRLFGISVSVLDYVTGTLTFDQSDSISGPRSQPLADSMRGPLLIPVLFLQPDNMQVRPESCEETPEGTVVIAESWPSRYRFHLKRGSDLPFQVEEGPLERDYLMTYWLYDYREFDGILLPSRYRQKLGNFPAITYKVRYEINPRYDPEVFKRPPSYKAGPDAWRLK